MTEEQNKIDGQVAIASLLAVFFILLTAGLLWFVQIKIPQEQAKADRLAKSQMAKTGTASEIDMAAVEAAIAKGGCAACHTIPEVGAAGQVGPNLSNIGADAASRIPGYSATEYIYESIADPLAFAAPECPFGPCIAGAMPPIPLEEAEIATLVAFLSTLGVE